MSDSISDFITSIRNASLARKGLCGGKFSKLNQRIADILKEDGFIRDAKEGTDANGHKRIEVTLKYVDEVPAITGLKRHSKPGRRLYYRNGDIPRVLGGLGVAILTTSKGIMTDRDARRKGIGGELLCIVW